MDFSVWPASNRTWAEVADTAVAAERDGWHGVWFADHFMPNVAGTVDAETVDMFADLEWPGTGAEVNALNDGTPGALTPTLYTVTWDVEDMDTSATWVRVRVRCTYDDATFGTSQGTTISSYRYRDS